MRIKSDAQSTMAGVDVCVCVCSNGCAHAQPNGIVKKSDKKKCVNSIERFICIVCFVLL